MDNPYKILDVSNTDSIEIITQKYRKLALKYHPDKNKSNNIDTTNKFIEISNAYNTIVKNHTKSVFNESSNKTKDSNTLFNNIAQNIINKSSNIKNIFNNINIDTLLKNIVNISELYENDNNSSNNNTQINSKKHSEDLYINVNIELFDIYNCIEKTIKISRLRKCSICYSLGIVVNKTTGLNMTICDSCNGKRYIYKDIELTFNCKFKNFLFIRKSHEYFNIVPGNIYLNIIPKIHNNYHIFNYYDLIYYYNIDLNNNSFISTIKNTLYTNNKITIEFSHLDNKKYKCNIDNPIYNYKYKLENMGLNNLEENKRGNLYIILINNNNNNNTSITRL
jgi:DnaJ-class molecular chaperone